MAEIVRQAQVIKNIIALLAKEFGYKVYADEVKEDFQKPCFFISATSVMTPQSVNWLQKELTVTLTYYAKASEKNEVHYMDVVDRVQMMFPVGIQTSDRFLKIESIEDDRVGEEDDILEITIVIPYLERANKNQESGDLMEEVSMNVIDSKENQFTDTITKEETGG